MRDYKQVLLPRSQRNAYVKLVDPLHARLYVPGVLDTVMHRNAQGVWLLNHTDYNVMKGLWQIDPKDVYSTVEELVNDELSRVVNEVMFDESIRD